MIARPPRSTLFPYPTLFRSQKSRVKAIVTFDGDAPEAFPPMSVTVTLEDEIDLSRGDMLVSPAQPPRVSRHFDAMVVWLDRKSTRLNSSHQIISYALFCFTK